MLPLLYALFTSASDRDAARLGADDWPTREAAHARLEVAGWRAWPSLASAERWPDAEVRRRAGTLLDGPRQDARAAAVHGLVLWLAYAPLEDATWTSLDRCAWDHGWLHDAVLAYAQERGLATPEEIEEFRGPWGCWWRGAAWCRLLRTIRGRAANGPE